MNQVTVCATDFHKSVEFYRMLGFRLIVSSRDQYARFELPDGEATFSIHLEADRAGDGPTIYFEVDDVDDTVNQLSARGISFSSQPTEQPWLWKEARFSDPAGNRLCIYHAGTNRRYPPWRINSGG